MCDPVSLTVASMVATGVGAGVNAYGQYQSGKASKYALQAQADTARMNAQISGINAQTTEVIGALNQRSVLEISELNAGLTERIGDINSSLTLELADLGDKVADGNYQLMLGTADANARIAEQNAQDVLIQGQGAEKSIRMESAQLKSTQIAQLAANGVALDSDSSLRILTSTDYLGEVDANTTHTNAVRQAMGYRAQAAAQLDSAKATALGYKASALGASISARADAFNTRLTSRVAALGARTAASFEALNIGINTRTDAMNQRIQGAGFTAQASQASIARAGIMPGLTAASTLLAGAGQVAGQWYGFNKAGAFG